MNQVAQLPSSPFLSDSTNTLGVPSSPHRVNKRKSVDCVNENIPLTNDDHPSPEGGRVPMSMEAALANDKGEECSRSSERCLPPRMKRKSLPVSPPTVYYDADQETPNVENTQPAPKQTSNFTNATSQIEETYKTGSRPATRSSARFRTKRGLPNAPTPGPQQKKRKLDENHEPAFTSSQIAPPVASSGLKATSKPETTARLTIRIPAMSFALNIKIDHTAELEKYPSRTFPTGGIPIDGDIEKLKGGKFAGFPLRLRRTLSIYATRKIIFNAESSKPTVARNPVGTSLPDVSPPDEA